MIADKAARERALDTSTSFIVQAPAGSGKTELLIQRYLKLLEIVEAPDGVVAITFTRKAAAEMRSRVVEALRKAESGPAPAAEHEHITYRIAQRVLEHDRRLNWNLARNPAQMRIETIDALCASITRRMPWMSRFGAMPQISEKAEDLYREAARNTLSNMDEDDPDLSHLLLHLDNDFQGAAGLIARMLEKRDQWLRLTGANRDSEAVRSALEASLQQLIEAELAHLRGGFDAETVREIVALLSLSQFPDARLEDLPQWKAIADLLVTTNDTWRKRPDSRLGFTRDHPLKAAYQQLLARLEPEDELLESLTRARLLPEPRYSEQQWQTVRAAVRTLLAAVGELQLVFRERGRVDFTELAIRASEALGRLDSPTDLALALGHRIHHILVDEFQDTSNAQYELLEKLTAGWEPGDGRTLFLVGDPMQSIYRFRQADVSLFLKAKLERIGALALEPLTLSLNFRSQPGIVEWVNRTFESILPKIDDVEAGAVTYSRSEAAAGPCVPFQEAVVHACTDKSDEARRVIDLVKGAGAGKTAVLVRARTHLPAIVAELKRNRIPFQAIEIDALGERPIIEDLMALTLALLHAGDRVSWLAILRAPWCGLRLEDLLTLAGADPRAAIWDLLHRQDLTLSEDGAVRIRRVLPVLEQAMAERGRLRLRDWVEDVWFHLGGPACAGDETALEDAAVYFDLLEGLEQGADIADFDWFREQVNSLFAQPDAAAGDRLQLMTIHKAKGLEFDTVILPGLNAYPKQEDRSLLLWLEQHGELLLAPISAAGEERDPIYRYLESVERRKADHETGRMLYVAATRARVALHLLATLSAKEDGSAAKPASGSFLQKLWPSVAHAFADLRPAPESEEVREPQKIRRVPADWAVPSAPPPLAWQRLEIQPMEPQPIAFEWVGERSRYAGTALHGLLQRIAREGLDAWDENAVRARRNIYRAVLANLGVSPDDLDETSKRVEAALLATLRDPRGRWILEAHQDAESEAPITGLIDGKLYEAVIDRTFIDDAGVRWIVDFKTGAHESSDVETFLDNEKDRYREQLERYARLMIQKDDRPIRLALYFPLLGGWREWPAPVVLRKQATLFEL